MTTHDSLTNGRLSAELRHAEAPISFTPPKSHKRSLSNGPGSSNAQHVYDRQTVDIRQSAISFEARQSAKSTYGTRLPISESSMSSSQPFSNMWTLPESVSADIDTDADSPVSSPVMTPVPSPKRQRRGSGKHLQFPALRLDALDFSAPAAQADGLPLRSPFDEAIDCNSLFRTGG